LTRMASDCVAHIADGAGCDKCAQLMIGAALA
jgi:hypothetical protein